MYQFMFQNVPVALCPQEINLEQGFNLMLFFFRCLYDEFPSLYRSDSKEVSEFNSNLMADRYMLVEKWSHVVCQVTSQEKPTHIQKKNLFSCLITFTKSLNV